MEDDTSRPHLDDRLRLFSPSTQPQGQRNYAAPLRNSFPDHASSVLGDLEPVKLREGKKMRASNT